MMRCELFGDIKNPDNKSGIHPEHRLGAIEISLKQALRFQPPRHHLCRIDPTNVPGGLDSQYPPSLPFQ